jgi:hypothetical protein
MTAAGFPHSGISGSQPTCGSPKLIAAYRALLRLSVPRHPPCALFRLTGFAPAPLESPPRSPGPRTGAHVDTRLVLTFPTTLPIPGFQSTKLRGVLCDSAHPSTLGFESFLLPKGPLTRALRKEVIQPQVPLRLPCYDFAPVTELAFGRSLPCGLGHDFGRSRLPWRDGRCVQGPGTYSPWCS